jgi:hypothetical protein
MARGAVVTVAAHSRHGEDDRPRHLKIFAPSYAAPAAWCVQD